MLLAVGRRPNTDDLGLDKAGVAVDDRGYVVVDDQLRTSVPGIWALGDCNGKGAFTHTSYNDGEIVIANLLENDRRRVSDRITAYALYVDPPLGRAGITEGEIRKSGRKALIAKRPMTRVGRAVEKGETQGFMKIAVDAETGAILVRSRDQHEDCESHGPRDPPVAATVRGRGDSVTSAILRFRRSAKSANVRVSSARRAATGRVRRQWLGFRHTARSSAVRVSRT